MYSFPIYSKQGIASYIKDQKNSRFVINDLLHLINSVILAVSPIFSYSGSHYRNECTNKVTIILLYKIIHDLIDVPKDKLV